VSGEGPLAGCSEKNTGNYLATLTADRLSKLTAIHDLVIDMRYQTSIFWDAGSWLPNCETAHPSYVSRVEHFPFGCPETSVNKYQPTPHNTGRPKTCGRPGQMNNSAPLQIDILLTFSA